MKPIISLVQMCVQQADVEANLAKGETFIAEAAKRGSLVVAFPEMWTTGFNFIKNKALAPKQDHTLQRLMQLAKQYKVWIIGSILTADKKGRACNSAILLNPEGQEVVRYNKSHLFTGMHEDQYVLAGNALKTVETPWGITGFSICYDIRFPEVFRTLAIKGASLIFCPIAVPYPRLEVWQHLVRARAIENVVYMVGINQVGQEQLEVEGRVTYFGHSCIIDPIGNSVIEAGDQHELLLTAEINMDLVRQTREKILVWKDRRPELYEL